MSLTLSDEFATALAEGAPQECRLIQPGEIRLSEIIAALSIALDITQGQPEGHSMRSALIGMRLAEELHLTTADRSALFYALLLKDLGCSSNAAKVCYLFGADDHLVKRSARMIDWTKAGEALRHGWTYCSAGGSVLEKLLNQPRADAVVLPTIIGNVAPRVVAKQADHSLPWIVIAIGQRIQAW